MKIDFFFYRERNHPEWRKGPFQEEVDQQVVLQCVISIWARFDIILDTRDRQITSAANISHLSREISPSLSVETHLVRSRLGSAGPAGWPSPCLTASPDAGCPPHGNFAHTARWKTGIQRRDLNEWDWDLFAFVFSPPPDSCMCFISCWLKVSYTISRDRFSGG